MAKGPRARRPIRALGRGGHPRRPGALWGSPGRLGLAVAGAVVAASSVAGAAETDLEFVRLVNEKRTIAIDEVVGDLVVVDGKVEIAGVVRGHVYAIGSEVAVRSSGIVLEPMTLAQGALHLEEGAVLPKSIHLMSARFFGPAGESVPPSGRLSLAEGATEVLASRGELSAASLALMRSTIPFDRFTPPPDMDVAELRAWHPGLGLELKKFVEDPEELVVGGVTKLTFVSEKVSGAFQRGYRGARGTVLLTGVRLVDDQAAKSLWSEIERVRSRVNVSLSLKSELGPGAHWFYRHHGRYCMLWQSGRWFIAVETRLQQDEGGSIHQQQQFNEQVVAALRRTLAGLRSLPQGVAR